MVFLVTLLMLTPANSTGITDPGASLAWLLQRETNLKLSASGNDGAQLMFKDRNAGWMSVRANPGPYARPRFTSPSFFYTIETTGADTQSLSRWVGLAHEIASHDDGSFKPVIDIDPYTRLLSYVPYWIALLIAVIVAALVRRFRDGRIIWDFRLAHAVQATVQGTLYLYWSLYWPGVRVQAPLILFQIALALAFDAVVSLWKLREWRVGLGVLPVVFSINLFGWFLHPAGVLLVVFVAVGSRVLIRRGSRHVFNPSGLGLAVTGALSLVFPVFAFNGTFGVLNMAPNTAEVLILIALLPQVRFRIVLVSVAAFVGLHIASHIVYDIPGATLPGTLVALALFITDPATMPETPVGRILFGLFVGIGMGVAATWLNSHGFADDLGKVFPVPLANLLVPVFDWAGRRIQRLSRQLVWLTDPRWNLAHVAIWLLLVIPSLKESKVMNFQASLHWTYGTPLVTRGPDDIPRCDDNPTFCNPFTFGSEAVLWASRLRGH